MGNTSKWFQVDCQRVWRMACIHGLYTWLVQKFDPD